MPPCTWMQSWVQCCAATGASVAATAAANSKRTVAVLVSPCSSSSIARAASHTAAVARSVSAIMPAHLCLMAWNWPIGRPNCSRILAYSDGGVGGPAGDADALRGQQGRHERAGQGAAQVAQHPVVADLDGVGAYVRDRPQRVDARRRARSRVASASRTTHSSPDSIADRQHQHRRLRGRGYRAHLTADHQPVAVPGGGQARSRSRRRR